MNTAKLQAFAQQARRQLMSAVAARLDAALAPNSRARIDSAGAVAYLEGELVHERQASGGNDAEAHDALVERYAYRWFNRIIALRYMDVHGFTRIPVVSPADLVSPVALPELLAAAKRGEYDEDALAVPGGEQVREQVEALFNGAAQPTGAAQPGGSQQAVDPQGAAYGLLLQAECRYWHGVMPFMFEGASGGANESKADELLMPTDLLAEGSVLRNAVEAMTPKDCGAEVSDPEASGTVDGLAGGIGGSTRETGNVEIIGWLYQFYISERKDEVMEGFKKNHKAGKDEIPAATQLFTPDWIVRYLVQNTVGRLWAQSHPDSQLHKTWEYYIEPSAGREGSEAGAAAAADAAAVADADAAADAALTIDSPQDLTVCDPACGSGHMLTYAFDLLYQIYEECGYAPSEIPGLILEHNLYGMEIDERAASLAQFALMMKARTRSRTCSTTPMAWTSTTTCGTHTAMPMCMARSSSRPVNSCAWRTNRRVPPARCRGASSTTARRRSSGRADTWARSMPPWWRTRPTWARRTWVRSSRPSYKATSRTAKPTCSRRSCCATGYCWRLPAS